MSRLRVPSPAMAVALLALFVALGGTGYAVTKINGKVLKNRTVAAKKLKLDQVGGAEINESRLGKVPSAKEADNAAKATRATAADNADTAANANAAVTAQTAGSATEAAHAANADSANDAKALGGVPSLLVNMAGRGSSASCNPDSSDLFPSACASVTLDLPKTSHVLVVASGSWYAPGAAAGTCRVERGGAVGQTVNLGQLTTTHNVSTNASGWSLTHVFSTVPSGSQKFDVVCTETSGDFHVVAPQIVAVRLAASGLSVILP